MNESTNKYLVVAVNNDGKRVLYNKDTDEFVSSIKDATIYDDHDDAINDWREIDKTQYKRVFVPNYVPEVFAEKLHESAVSREQMIAELKKVKPSYNYNRFNTAQIASMYNKYVLNAQVKKDKVVLQDADDAEEETIVREKCPECNTYLNDGGTCPKCDDGEEDLTEALYNPNCEYVAATCWPGMAAEIADLACRALRLQEHEVEMLEHDINNLRANEWVDAFADLPDTSDAKKLFFQYAVKCDDAELEESVNNPYESIANKIVNYAKRDPQRVELYDTYEEYVDGISYESAFEFPTSAPGFTPADANNITDEEAAEFIELLFQNTDLRSRLDAVVGTGGNGHSSYGPSYDDLDDEI